MPIAVSCPSCSAVFKVKDEYAGKRAKCPKCGEPLTIPPAFDAGDTVKVPPPAARTAARAVARPQPADDEEEDTPKPKRRRDEDEEVGPTRERGAAGKRRSDQDEDEKPRSRKRADDNEEEEKPRSKRRQDDDDEERPKKKRRRDDDGDDKPKKKSALPLVLGILGGVVVLCGGGCAGVWFGVIAPAAEKARKLNDEKQAELDRWEKELNKPQASGGLDPNAPGDRKYTQQDMNRVQAGMTQAQVEGLLGKSRLPDDFDMLRAFNGPDSEKAWGNKRKEKCVLVWGSLSNLILVAFTTPPANGGTVLGVLGVFGVERIEPIKLPGSGPPAPTTSPDMPIEMAAADLLAEYARNPEAANAKYKGQWMKLTGDMKSFNGQTISFGEQKAGEFNFLLLASTFGSRAPNPKPKAGDRVTVLGKMGELFVNNGDKSKSAQLTEGKFIR